MRRRVTTHRSGSRAHQLPQIRKQPRVPLADPTSVSTPTPVTTSTTHTPKTAQPSRSGGPSAPLRVPFTKILGLAKQQNPISKLAVQGKPSHDIKAASTTPKPNASAHSHESRVTRDPKQERDEVPFDPLDPATRHAAQLGTPQPLISSPVAAQVSSEVAPVETRARVSMEDLLPQLVKRIAWAGDRRRGTVQMELGAGRHAGTTITVHAEDGRVRVELDGHDVDALRSRIDARLKERGIHVESVS